MKIRAAVLTVSDQGSAGLREDKSGPAIVESLQELVKISWTGILPDEKELISERLKELADGEQADVIFTTGGTGFAPRDVTPEATLQVIEKQVPGIPEAMRLHSMNFTNRAMLSRGVAGIRKSTLIINLPGSPKAVCECLEVCKPILEHAVETLKGSSYECARKE